MWESPVTWGGSRWWPVAIHWEFLVCNWANISSHPSLWVSKLHARQAPKPTRPAPDPGMSWPWTKNTWKQADRVPNEGTSANEESICICTGAFHSVCQLCDFAGQSKKVLDWGLRELHDYSYDFLRDFKIDKRCWEFEKRLNVICINGLLCVWDTCRSGQHRSSAVFIPGWLCCNLFERINIWIMKIYNIVRPRYSLGGWVSVPCQLPPDISA